MDTSLWLIMTKKDGRGMSEEVTKSQGNNKFLKGTLILTISSIVVKVIGALNWVILSRIMGGEGIGPIRWDFLSI